VPSTSAICRFPFLLSAVSRIRIDNTIFGCENVEKFNCALPVEHLREHWERVSVKSPKGDVLLFGLLLLGGGIYTVLPISKPMDVAYLQDLTFGGALALVGIMVLAHFRWSPEFVVAVFAVPIAWCVCHMTFEGITKNRLLILLGALVAINVYWPLRKQLRPPA
jgi:hypothetical protein